MEKKSNPQLDHKLYFWVQNTVDLDPNKREVHLMTEILNPKGNPPIIAIKTREEINIESKSPEGIMLETGKLFEKHWESCINHISK